MMKIPFILLLATSGILLACSKDDSTNEPEDTTGIVGTWQLIEQLADPGDGSGVFHPTENDLRLTFRTNGSYTSTNSLCSVFGDPQNAGTGTYNTEKLSLHPAGCEDNEWLSENGLPYKLENGNLIVYYFCIEGCAQKFEKVK
ncbi:hypothetical protein [Reichenbachiella sp. MSK19-1]|uniref:hypothetical protein n=1 Tax=Reichenbachiella sp. MSK19-1 TaxID=1897631 RepID=UPI0011C3D262|nr:hypothetical protein [Reichenbachiella sp. MSK19-1]